jgi:hypothetical protein
MTPKQRGLFFAGFFLIFLCTAAITLLGITGVIKIDPTYLTALFSGLILEVVGAMIALFRLVFIGDQAAMPDINGYWKYRCTVHAIDPGRKIAVTRDGDEPQHGGTCPIQTERTPFGIKVSLEGQRLWSAYKVEGEWKHANFEPPQKWISSWGAITGEDKIQYDYSAETGRGTLHTYAWAMIKCDEREKPCSMEGNFYQLPPYRPSFGSLELSRLDDSADTPWSVINPVREAAQKNVAFGGGGN